MLYTFNRSSDRGITNTTSSCDHWLDVDVLDDEEEGWRDTIVTRSEVRQLHKTMALNHWHSQGAREALAPTPLFSRKCDTCSLFKLLLVR